MKRIALVLLMAGIILTLSQCELFYTTVEYNISGNSDSLTIRYNGDEDMIEDVTASSPWSHSFELYSDERPFVAFIQVVNDGLDTVTVQILEDGDVDIFTDLAAGATTDLYYIIE